MPIEWNILMVYGGIFLFGVHPEAQLSALTAAPWLLAFLLFWLVAVPAFGNFFPVARLVPARDALLRRELGLQHLALPKGQPSSKLEKLKKASGTMRAQLEAVLARPRTRWSWPARMSLAHRFMHLEGRALLEALPLAVDDIDDYEWIDGELVSGMVLGWNFGDGHLNRLQLLEAVQQQCGFEEGELRVVMVESQPFVRAHDAMADRRRREGRAAPRRDRDRTDACAPALAHRFPCRGLAPRPLQAGARLSARGPASEPRTTPMRDAVDAIVVGSGPRRPHGGDRARAAGLSVRVLEAAETRGGGTPPREPHAPGSSTTSARPSIRWRLLANLGRPGSWTAASMGRACDPLAHPFDDGGRGRVPGGWSDRERLGRGRPRRWPLMRPFLARPTNPFAGILCSAAHPAAPAADRAVRARGAALGETGWRGASGAGARARCWPAAPRTRSCPWTTPLAAAFGLVFALPAHVGLALRRGGSQASSQRWPRTSVRSAARSRSDAASTRWTTAAARACSST